MNTVTDIGMDFELSEDQRAIRRLADQILADKIGEHDFRKLEESGESLHHEAWEALGASGLLGAALPENVGGGGMTLVEAAVVAEAVGFAGAPMPFWSHVAAALAVADHGPELAAAAARGSKIIAPAIYETGQNEPLASTVKARAAGAAWTVSGVKTCVPGGGYADAFVVLADDTGSPGLYLVAADAAGANISSQRGTDYSRLGHLTLDAAPARRLGGGDAAVTLVQTATLLAAATQLGAAERALKLTAEYTRERTQFGKPLSYFQAVTQRAADAYVHLIALRLSLQQALYALCSDGEHPNPTLAVPLTKYWAAEAGHFVTFTASHLHGGAGFDRDYPLYRSFLLSRQLEVTLGSAPVQLAAMGRVLAQPDALLGEAF